MPNANHISVIVGLGASINLIIRLCKLTDRVHATLSCPIGSRWVNVFGYGGCVPPHEKESFENTSVLVNGGTD